MDLLTLPPKAPSSSTDAIVPLLTLENRVPSPERILSDFAARDPIFEAVLRLLDVEESYIPIKKSSLTEPTFPDSSQPLDFSSQAFRKIFEFYPVHCKMIRLP